MWTRFASATSDTDVAGAFVAYDLYVWGLDAPGPYALWYIERRRTTASFLDAQVVTDFASFDTNSGFADSAAAWSDRTNLIFNAELLSPTYPGHADLRLATSSGGGSAMSLTQELPAVPLTAGQWTDVSAGMTAETSYVLSLPSGKTGRVTISADQPAPYNKAAPQGYAIGSLEQLSDNDQPVRYTDSPVWVWTPYRGTSVQVFEVAA